ncbi:DUF1996 domain-containing protein [Burkholderia sp. S171]|uniref:DUF1996 domain-containing protein n=1 Tax=Burkholderia sp. S171 TaxID=1641860 RepID=UPI00131C5C2F|nr:DUF1996 domain-containing protein [Burkholderia sp. S171]
MKRKIVIWTMFMLAAGAAHAANFNTQCNYSHTLPDDPIVYPGKAGEAMVHDFFGNTNTNASSTYDSLNSNKATTCDSNADRSAYWAPQLKRASGVINATYEKTYYKDDQHVASYPINAIPLGLQMLAGDHMGKGPNPHVNFLCLGSGNYTTTMPTSCPSNSASGGDPSELDISVHFPDCWDGVNLVPNLGSGRENRMKGLMKAAKGKLNVAYRNSDGTCPSGYPVKIPELQLNISYPLGADPDLTTAQLSLDPIFQNGQWVPQWGSMYTAHGDFINAWHAESMQFIVDSCMNKPSTPGSTCGKNIPTYYSAASADVRLTGSGSTEATGATLVSDPGDVIFIKFPTPANLDDYVYASSYLQTLAGNVSDTSTITLDLYAASTDWDDTTKLPSAASCTTQKIGGIYLNNAQQVRNNDISSYVASQKAAAATQIGICVRNATGKTVQFSSRDGSWTPGLYLK